MKEAKVIEIKAEEKEEVLRVSETNLDEFIGHPKFSSRRIYDETPTVSSVIDRVL